MDETEFGPFVERATHSILENSSFLNAYYNHREQNGNNHGADFVYEDISSLEGSYYSPLNGTNCTYGNGSVIDGCSEEGRVKDVGFGLICYAVPVSVDTFH